MDTAVVMAGIVASVITIYASIAEVLNARSVRTARGMANTEPSIDS
jgi:hypothetical protein